MDQVGATFSNHKLMLCRAFLLKRYPSAKNWQEIEQSKAQLPHFELSPESFAAMPVWVISLKLSTDRRAAVAQSLQAQALDFEFVDAVDGQDDQVEWEQVQCQSLQLQCSDLLSSWCTDIPCLQIFFTQWRHRRQGFLNHNQYMMGKVVHTLPAVGGRH